MLEQTIAAAGLHDDPEQQELLHRCLQVLHSSRPADMPAKREAGGGQWRRCVQPSKDGPPPRGGATLTAVGSALWLIGGLDAARGALTPDVFSLDTTVGARLSQCARRAWRCALSGRLAQARRRASAHAAFGAASPLCLRRALAARAEPSAWSLEHGSVRGGAEHNGTGTPAARFGHAACARGAVVWLFGGHAGPDGHASADDSGVFSDVHALDTRTCAWVEARAADAPEARHAHSLCYDAHGDQLLLFGGADGKSKPLGGLHALPLGSLGVDGLPDAPSAEAGHSAPPGDRAESVPLRWVSIEPSGGGPCAREMHASAVTCPARDGTAAEAPPVMLVCGGRAAGQVLSDLWVLHLGASRDQAPTRRRARDADATYSDMPSPCVRAVCPLCRLAHMAAVPVSARSLQPRAQRAPDRRRRAPRHRAGHLWRV